MQKMLEAKAPQFVEGQFVTTREGTGEIVCITPAKYLAQADFTVPVELDVRLDRGDMAFFYADEVVLCDAVGRQRGVTEVKVIGMHAEPTEACDCRDYRA